MKRSVLKTIFKRLPALLVLFFVATACSKNVNSAPPVIPPPVTPPGDTPRIFRVTGTTISLANNTPFVLKGVNVNGPYWPWARPTVPDVSLIIDNWKFNTVRVNCWPQFSTINNNNPDLDAIVQAFTTRQVVVMLEHHNFTGKYPTATELTEMAAWWLTLAKKYKGNEYVWFNVMNEPGDNKPVPAEWLTSHETVIKAIRGAGANNIIVCDENAFGQANGYNNDASSGIITYGPQLISKYKNLVFSLHLYDQWVYGKTKLENYIAKVRSNNLALIIGEYGTAADVSMNVASEMFKVCIAEQVGRIAWQWTGEDIHRLTTNGGGWMIDHTGGGKPGNLGFVGNLVWDDNHETLTASAAALEPTAVIFTNGGFESGSPAAGQAVANGWINFGAATIDQTAANVKEGANAVKIAAGQASGCGQNMYLKPGGTYRLTASGKHSAVPGVTSFVGIKSTNGAGVESTIASLDFSTTKFETKTTIFTMPADPKSAFLVIYKNDTVPDFWCDGITIVQQ